jgi:hypothetical protein
MIEIINPEVIFEEIPPTYFDLYYKAKTEINLETQTINMYLENHSIQHVPVDYYDVQKSLFENIRKVLEKVERGSRKYCQLVDDNKSLTGRYGFQYLNSDESENIHSELSVEIRETLKKIKDCGLMEIWNTWEDVEQKREVEMINNIYSFSKNNEFKTGLFLIGAAHRRSIISKIENRMSNESGLVNWNYRKYDTCF